MENLYRGMLITVDCVVLMRKCYVKVDAMHD